MPDDIDRINRRGRLSTLAEIEEGASEAWPDLIPLDLIPDVPGFPEGVFPEAVETFVSETAWATNTPRDFAATTALPVAAAAIGNSAALSITESYAEPPILWAVSVGSPGSGKTPSQKQVTGPLENLQHAQRQLWQQAMEVFEGTGPKPVCSRCVVSDTTTESLARVLNENPRGVLMFLDEVSALASRMDQYKAGKGADRQVYLTLWSGGRLLIDRRSDQSLSGAPLIIPRPFVAIAGGIQPEALERLKGSSADDGWMDRFLFAHPPELPAVGETWRTVSRDSQEAWAHIVGRLAGQPMMEEASGPRPRHVHLTPCGREAWEEFTTDHAAEINSLNFRNSLKGCWSKMKGYGARLSLVVHRMRWAAGEDVTENVDGESVTRAAALVAYFKKHAVKVRHSLGIDPEIRQAKRILEWLKKTGTKEFKLWECARALRDLSIPEVKSLDRPVEILEEHNYVKRKKKSTKDYEPSRGRPPADVFEVHPTLSFTLRAN